MTNPKQMNANYRKNERLLETNPTPIDIGLSEDVKDYIDDSVTEVLPEYTTSDDGKILGVTVDSSGETPVAEVGWVAKPTQVQADWNEADTTAVDYIKNKPTIPEGVPAYTTSDDGKVLGVTVDSSGETPVAEIEWVESSGGLPSYTSTDAAKVLRVNPYGSSIEWYRQPHVISSYERIRDKEWINTSGTIHPNDAVSVSLSLSDYGTSDYDFIVLFTPASKVTVSNYWANNTTTLSLSVKNISTSDILANNTFGHIYVYRRPKYGSLNDVIFLGGVGSDGLYSKELPSYSSADSGKVLSVNASGELEWITPGS